MCAYTEGFVYPAPCSRRFRASVNSHQRLHIRVSCKLWKTQFTKLSFSEFLWYLTRNIILISSKYRFAPLQRFSDDFDMSLTCMSQLVSLIENLKKTKDTRYIYKAQPIPWVLLDINNDLPGTTANKWMNWEGST